MERLEKADFGKGKLAGWLLENLKGLFYGLSHLPLSGLLRPFLFTFFSWLVMALNFYIIARVIAIQLPYFYCLFIYPLVSLVQLFPVTVAGFGTREAALLYCFSHFGVSAERTVAFSLIYFFIWLTALVIPGLIISLFTPVKGRRTS